MPYPTHEELQSKWATQAEEAYVDGLVGQPLPCGCHIMLGKNAVICDDPCHTAYRIVYHMEQPNVVEESSYHRIGTGSHPVSDLNEYIREYSEVYSTPETSFDWDYPPVEDKESGNNLSGDS